MHLSNNRMMIGSLQIEANYIGKGKSIRNEAVRQPFPESTENAQSSDVSLMRSLAE